jgi:hypothetical protein
MNSWFIIGVDLSLLGQPSLAGLYGPYPSREAAEADLDRAAENGTTLLIASPQLL